MANLKSTTAANAIFLLTVPGLFPVPVQIQGFTTDTEFTTDAIATTEATMGVDGHLSAGVVLHPTKQKISLMPDSDSIAVFDTWRETQQLSLTVFFADAVIVLPATGKTYTLTRGALTNSKQAPDVKKTLQPQEYEITWESVTVVGVL